VQRNESFVNVSTFYLGRPERIVRNFFFSFPVCKVTTRKRTRSRTSSRGTGQLLPSPTVIVARPVCPTGEINDPTQECLHAQNERTFAPHASIASQIRPVQERTLMYLRPHARLGQPSVQKRGKQTTFMQNYGQTMSKIRLCVIQLVYQSTIFNPLALVLIMT
jgi:hypothetical protein